jgi:tetratricopeptide (TPR) repeat protein
MNPSIDASAGTPTDTPQPAAWHKGLVALFAVLFFLYPYLFSARPQPTSSLGSELVGDGLTLVTQHEALLAAQTEPSLGNILGTMGSTWWGGVAANQSLYRPIPSLLLGIAGAASGPYDESAPADRPFLYHAFALGLNVMCALLVFELALFLFKRTGGALVAGALFATLPIHGEVIFDVAGLAELCATAFSLAAWLAWLRAGDRPFARPGQLLIAAVCLFFATLSKESAFALPLVFVLFDIGRAPAGGSSFGAGVSHALSKLPALLVLVVVLAVSLGVRYSVTGAILPSYVGANALENPLIFQGVATRMMNALRIMAAGVAAIFGVNMLSSNWNYGPDYSATQIPVYPAFELWNLVGLVAVAGSLALAVVLYRQCRTRAALVFALFGSLLLTSNLITSVGTIFADRLMFFPSVMAVLFVTAFLAKRGTVGVALGLALAIGGGVWNWTNAAHWKDQTQLWTYASDHSSPKSARAHLNNGVDAFTDQVYQLARQEFEEAIDIFPRYAQGHAYLGFICLTPQERDYLTAIEHLGRACEIQLEDYHYDYPDEPVITTASFGPRSLLYHLTRLRLFTEEEGVHAPSEHLAWLDSLIAKGYDSAYVHHRRATALAATGAPDDEVIAAFERSVEREQTRDCIEAYGKYLLDTGRPQEALTLYRTVDEFPRADEKVRLLLARAEAEFVDGPEAVLRTADELWKMRDELAFSGEYRFSEEQEFRTLYLRARAKYALTGGNPNEEQLRELRGILRRAVGAWKFVSDETFEANALLTHILLALGEDEEARIVLEALIAQRSAPSLRFQLGNLYTRQGRLVDALDQFEQIDGNLSLAVVQFPDDPQFANILTTTRATVLNIYRALGREDDAHAAVERWHQAAPTAYDPIALLVHAYYALGEGDTGTAFNLADLLSQQFPDDPSGPQLYDDLTALRDLETKVESGSNDPAIYEQLASFRRKFNYSMGALEMARRAVELSASAPPNDRARRLSLLAACQELAGNLQASLDALRTGLALPLDEEGKAVFQSEIARVEAMLTE